MEKPYFSKKVEIDVENFSRCGNGDLKFDIVLSDPDGMILKLVGCRWNGTRLMPAADRLPRPAADGHRIYWNHWLNGKKLERGILMALENANRLIATSQ